VLREARIFTLLSVGMKPGQIGREVGGSGTAIRMFAARRGWMGKEAYDKSISDLQARRVNRAKTSRGAHRSDPELMRSEAARRVDMVIRAAKAGNADAIAAITPPNGFSRRPSEIAAFVADALTGVSSEPFLPLGDVVAGDLSAQLEAARAALAAFAPWRIAVGGKVSPAAYKVAWSNAEMALRQSSPKE
jgi:hypothetical protein